MAYDPNNLWSEVEDNAVREFYAKYGRRWVGWSEVLPTRTLRAISARATRLGVKRPTRREPKRKARERDRPKGDERHYNVGAAREPDPYEGYVMACMESGLTPTQIDQRMHWRTGTTVLILTERWERENEEEDNRDQSDCG